MTLFSLNKIEQMANNLQVMRNLKNGSKPLSGLTYIKNLMPTTICSMVNNPNSKLMQEVNTNDDFLLAAQKITGFCATGDKSNISASFSDLAKMIKNKYRPSAVSLGTSMSAPPVLGAAARKREYVARKAAEAAAAAAAAANAAAANAARKAAANAANAQAANAAAAAAETAAAANAEAAATAAAAASVSTPTAQGPSNLNTIRQQVAKLDQDLQGLKNILNTATAAGGKRRKTRSKRKSSTRRN
jgi:hypothetical protein